MISIIIPIYITKQNIFNVTVACLNDVMKTTGDIEIIVIDDGSQHNGTKLLQKIFPDMQLIRQDNMGFAGAVNTGIAQATGEYIVLWLPL